jgi:hypothetical protein
MPGPSARFGGILLALFAEFRYSVCKTGTDACLHCVFHAPWKATDDPNN